MEAADEAKPEVDREPNARPAGWTMELALVFLVFFTHSGAPVPHVNETYYLTKAKHYWNPAWCAGDMFLESADAHATFYWTLGWLTKHVSLEAAAWIGRVVAWALLAWAWATLNRRLFSLPFAAVLTAVGWVVLTHQTHFAGEWVVGGVEAKCFAWALVVFALAELVHDRWRRVFPLLGAAAAFHPLVGGWAVIAAAFVWVTEPRNSRPHFGSLCLPLLIGGAIAAIGVIPALALSTDVPSELRSDANQVYVFDRLAHHLAPLHMRPSQLQRRGWGHVAIVVVFAVLVVVARRSGYETVGTNRTIRFAVATLLLTCVGLCWELATWDHPALAASLLRYYWFRMGDIAVPLAVSLLLVLLLGPSLSQRRPTAIGVAALLLLAAGWQMLRTTTDRWVHPCPPADAKMLDFVAWRDACDWINTHTAADAMFLVPQNSQSFNWRAERPSVVIRKDVPQDAKSLIEWRDRLFDIFYETDAAGTRHWFRSLASQGTKRILTHAEKYDFDYVVTLTRPRLQLRVVYANDVYAVYATSPAAHRVGVAP